MKLQIQDAKDLATKILLKAGYSKEESEICANHCLEGELVGKKSHGFVRIPKLVGYVENDRVHAGKPGIEIKKETAVSILVDGLNKTGLYVVEKATDLGIQKAKESGLVAVGVTNTAPLSGMIGYYARKVTEQDLIFLAFNNSSGGMVPHGSTKEMFGTNPITFGIPTHNLPVILDMASTQITWGDLLVAKSEGSSIPKGVAIDDKGKITTDPEKAMTGGLLPIAGHKGSGLGLIVELLGGALTQSRVGNNVQGGWGSFNILIDPTLFRDLKEFKDDVQTALDELKSSPKRDGFDEIFYPGERSQRLREENLKNGEVDIGDEIYEKLEEIISNPKKK